MMRFAVAVVAALVLAAPASAMRWLDGAGHTINVPADISVEATGALTDVAYSVTVTPADEAVSCDAGSSFPVGTTQVHCTAADADPQSFNVTVADNTSPDLIVPDDFTADATSTSGADVSYTVSASDAVGVTSLGCDHDPGHFDFGATTVTCTAQDAAAHSTQKSFTVTVKDTTAPAISPHGTVNDTTESPSGKDVSYDPPTATDLGQSVNVGCTPPSGSHFAVGKTTVTCTADDAHGNRSQTMFDVNLTLVDTTAPVLSGVPSGIAQDTQDPAGAIVSFPATPSAMDNVDGLTPVACTPKTSGDLFPVGTTHVTCKATDKSGNSASDEFDVVVTLVDHTKPVLSGVPGGINDTTESPSGKVVAYALPTANDNLDGAVPVKCDPGPGSSFPLGTTPVTCSATDAHGNTQQASFSVTLTLIDVTAPVLTGVSSDRFVEANGPTGSIVTFATPTATDNLDGALALVGCSPASGTLFSLGPHLVTCSATDAHSNVGSASFHINVVDTTPPTIAVPGPTSVYATTPTGIPESAPAFQGFRAAASASDIVDPSPYITDNLGSFAELGPHTVNFIAHDASGNAQGRSTTLTVLPMPPAGTPPLPAPAPAKPPPNVSNLQVVTGDGFVRLVWNTVSGVVQYLVYRSQGGARRLADGHGDLVYKGTATTYTDRGVKNGVEYRYVVVSQDSAGNQSAGVAAAATPRLNLLRAPKDGARLKSAPKLMWARNAEAAYYNVQLYRGQQKILSSWPLVAAMKLKRTWKYEGKRFTLTTGVYRWYVWPGFGARAAVDYGELLGSNSFSMIR